MNPLKPGFLTSEFWVTSVLSGLSLLGAAGIVGPSDLPALSENVKTIVLGVFALANIITYVLGRVQLKKNQ